MKSKFSNLKQHRGALLSFFAVLIFILSPTIWFRASMTGFDWILVALIVTILALAFYVYAVWKKRRVNKQSFYVFLPLLAIMVGLLILHTRDELSTYEIIHIMAIIALVSLTAVYATQTTIMAKEMKEQRYDSVRPVIDITRIEHGEGWAESQALLTERTKEAYGNYSRGLSCRLHNIGVGPATDVYSFVQTPAGKCQLLPFGALAKDERTDKYPLSLKQSDNRTVLIAYYRDVYDNCFESSREVIKGKVHLGQLKISKIPKEEFPK